MQPRNLKIVLEALVNALHLLLIAPTIPTLALYFKKFFNFETNFAQTFMNILPNALLYAHRTCGSATTHTSVSQSIILLKSTHINFDASPWICLDWRIFRRTVSEKVFH